MIPFLRGIYIGESIETESSLEIASGYEEGRWKVRMGTEFLFGTMICSGISGDGCEFILKTFYFIFLFILIIGYFFY